MKSSLRVSESAQSASKLRDKLSVLSLQGAPLRLPSICGKSSPYGPVARIPRAGDLPRRSLEGGSWLGPARIDSQKNRKRRNHAEIPRPKWRPGRLTEGANGNATTFHS